MLVSPRAHSQTWDSNRSVRWSGHGFPFHGKGEPAEFARSLERVPTRVAQQVVRHARDEIGALFDQAETRAEAQGESLAAAALASARLQHGAEIERLAALAKVNPNIREEEIDQAREALASTERLLSTAAMRMEAARVVIAT